MVYCFVVVLIMSPGLVLAIVTGSAVVGILDIHSEKPVITDVQSALDLIATARYETGCDGVIIPKAAVAEDFFILSTRLAGEILQKFITYEMKLAIVGDFSGYTSKSLRDFIYESNNGNAGFFVGSEDKAVKKLATMQ